jgi:hypothetical protein
VARLPNERRETRESLIAAFRAMEHYPAGRPAAGHAATVPAAGFALPARPGALPALGEHAEALRAQSGQGGGETGAAGK